MKKYSIQWVQEWCQENGWTDLFVERRSYWAFPPHAVMPMPIPDTVLQSIKADKGMSTEEKLWCAAAWIVALSAAGISYWISCPMPMVMAFAFCAVTAGLFEEE